jgi:transcriptional regulator with GAF, ATPase, and Fis domain
MPTSQTVSLIYQSSAMRTIIERIEAICHSDSSVLLIGETGVGKELIAEHIHRSSNRRQSPLVKVGLSALPHELLESELFGHEKGSYTSASYEKKGLFELADHGTIVLDDIDDFPLPLQSKLLRVLESREINRLGGIAPIPVNVRVITTTKINLKELVERGMFRADLFYRLNVVPIVIPPLRHRREDIPPLVEHFLHRFAPDKILRISPEAQEFLNSYSWPGNVRELRNVVQRVCLFTDSTILPTDLPQEITGENPLELLLKSCAQCFVGDHMSLDGIVACLEKNLIRHALQQSNGNRTQAAAVLKISPSTLRDKLKKYHTDGSRNSVD